MKPKPKGRLDAALSLADRIKADLERTEPKRSKRVLTTWSPAEFERLADAAERHHLPVAARVHRLTLTALDALESGE